MQRETGTETCSLCLTFLAHPSNTINHNYLVSHNIYYIYLNLLSQVPNEKNK